MDGSPGSWAGVDGERRLRPGAGRKAGLAYTGCCRRRHWRRGLQAGRCNCTAREGHSADCGHSNRMIGRRLRIRRGRGRGRGRAPVHTRRSAAVEAAADPEAHSVAGGYSRCFATRQAVATWRTWSPVVEGCSDGKGPPGMRGSVCRQGVGQGWMT